MLGGARVLGPQAVAAAAMGRRVSRGVARTSLDSTLRKGWFAQLASGHEAERAGQAELGHPLFRP